MRSGEFRVWQREVDSPPCKHPKGKEPNQAHAGWVKLGCAVPNAGTRCWKSPTSLGTQNGQCHKISDPQTHPGHSLMPTGQSPGACGSIAILVESHLPLEQILLRRSKLANLLWGVIILTALQGAERWRHWPPMVQFILPTPGL